MVDGSGLARADYITPHDLAKLQYLAGGGPAGSEYKESLISRDGGALRWKAGAMSSIRSYTGYALGDSGEEFCFALMVNHFEDGEAVTALAWELFAALREL